jgi:hypothetical protein
MVGYGTIYRFEFDATCKPFASLLTTKCKVLILKKGYNATIFDIPYGQVTPVEIDYPTVDDDIFYPIKGSSLSFKVLGGVINMDSLISEDEKDFYLEYYRDNALFWSGFVSPELCEEDIFLRYPAIEFKTIDGLGSLTNTILLDTDNRYLTGKVKLIDVITAAFKSIGFGYNSNTLINMWNMVASSIVKENGILWSTYSNMSVFKDKNGISLKPIDIIKSICYLFNAVIYQNRGQWWFVKIKDLAFGLYTTVKYDSLGNKISSTGTIKQFVHGTDFLILAEPKRKIRRFYRDVQLTYEYYKGPKNVDTDFSSFRKDNISTTFRKLQSTGTDGLLQVTVLDEQDGSGVFKYDYYDILNVTPCFNNDTQKWSAYVSNENSTSGYIDFKIGVDEGDSFSISLRNISQSSRIYIKHDNFELSNNIKYYNPTLSTWQSTDPLITWLQSEILSISSITVPDTGSLTVRLYCHPGFDFCLYTDFSFILEEITNDKQVTTITNIKNTTITAPPVTVLIGDYKENGTGQFDDFVDPSNLFDWANEYPTKEWYERDETDVYDIQELSARNILNQYSDYRNIFTGTLIGKQLEFGCIYTFPIQGALAGKKFFPLSMKMNERDCTAEVVFMELTSNEITGAMNQTIFDSNGIVVYQTITSSKKKNRNGVGTDLGEAGDFGTLFDRFVAFFMDDFKP